METHRNLNLNRTMVWKVEERKELKMSKHPALLTILLVEDRISEILESGNLEKYDSRGNPTEKMTESIESLRNFKKLTMILTRFYEGRL